MFFTEDNEAVRQLARGFAENTLAPVAAEIDRTHVIPREIIDTMSEVGLLGMKIPEEYGGAGMDNRSYVLAIEEISRKSATMGVYLSSTSSLAVTAILLAATEEQKHKYLPGVPTGERFISFALTEPGAGSDAGGIKMTALKDGDAYVLNGRKCFISGAPIAQTAVVFARTGLHSGSHGITAFILDMDSPGVFRGKDEERMGVHGLPTGDIVLENVRVPKENILGQVNFGFIIAMKTLCIGRVGIAAQGVGIAQGAIDEAVSYVKKRTQFGKKLSEFQNTQFSLAEMETQLNAARLLTYNAAWKLDNGEDITKESAMAKLMSADVSVRIVDRALQMHGGYGYSQECTIERLYRDVRILPLYEGTSEVQKMIIAERMLRDGDAN
jgi:cyclohexanecarboxyl-CoA dehydrogenase